MRTQRPRIYKQPGTGTQEPCRFCWVFLVWVLAWFPLNSQGRDPSTRRGSGPRRFYLALRAILSVFLVPWSAGFFE